MDNQEWKGFLKNKAKNGGLVKALLIHVFGNNRNLVGGRVRTIRELPDCEMAKTGLDFSCGLVDGSCCLWCWNGMQFLGETGVEHTVRDSG